VFAWQWLGSSIFFGTIEGWWVSTTPSLVVVILVLTPPPTPYRLIKMKMRTTEYNTTHPKNHDGPMPKAATPDDDGRTTYSVCLTPLLEGVVVSVYVRTTERENTTNLADLTFHGSYSVSPIPHRCIVNLLNTHEVHMTRG